ncbi:hypothetical protein KBD81_01525 [Candidatus Woesebacteria bacterium]|nr:hypothetical protein [Candidatus Woesebacteria bacterium]
MRNIISVFIIVIGLFGFMMSPFPLSAVDITSTKSVKIPVQNNDDVTVEVDGSVLSVRQSPRYVVVSGTFSSVRVDNGTEIDVKNVAIVDLERREVLTWIPQANGAIFGIESYNNLLFLSGNFTQIGTVQQPYLAVFDTDSKQLSATQYQVNGAVNTLNVFDSTLLLGGDFTQVLGVERSHIAGISLEKQIATVWNPGANDIVTSFARDDRVLYVGGSFTQIAGQSRTYLASFYLPSGVLSEWAPMMSNRVQNLTLQNGVLVVEIAPTEADVQPIVTSVPIDTTVVAIETQDITIGSVQTQDEKNSDLMVDEGALGFQIPTLAGLLTFAIRIFFVIAGVTALFYMLMGALAWVTSGGDKDSVAAAREKIQAAVIGLIMMVVVLAVVWTMEQVIFKRRICLGLTCPLTLPSIIKTNDEL